MIARRRFLIVGSVAFTLLAAPVAAEAQKTERIWRIGRVGPGAPAVVRNKYEDTLIGRLRELGYVDGKNAIVTMRYASGGISGSRNW